MVPSNHGTTRLKQTIWTFLRPGILPFMWALMFASFTLAYQALGLPEPEETVRFVREAFDAHGLWVVTAAAFIEGLFMVSVYFPGSLVIVLAVLFAGDSLGEVVLVSFLAWAGFVAALPVNYWLGQQGFYRILLRLGRADLVVQMQQWLARRGQTALFLSAFHPNILAIATVCLGIARYGQLRSLILGSLYMLPWLALVVVLVRTLSGEIDPSESNQAWYFTVALVVWGSALVAKGHWTRQRQVRDFPTA